ncbi:hypothetical protein PF004_g23329 [Phytophthora fragariae]|uniref:WLGC domain-containing protein n=1 Tax=Phytophthora fragariae TaxID=53985 RepID=A0A6G0MYL7_9STRA|nr:hypothetical protein PF004_g23329 [Phytophthora fragariae]
MVREADKENHRLIFTFREAFGILGVPILGTLVACIAWTTWLIYIALAPNQAANWLMGTSTYDNGQFWSIIDTTPVMTNIGAACLVLVDLCYLYVVVKMLRWRTTVARLYATSSRPHEDIRVDPTTDSWIRTASDRVKTNYHELTSFRGSKRKFWMTVLLELLETGSPAALVYGYTGFISVGSLAGAVKILVGRFSAMGEIIAGSIFDLIAAIVFPVLVLVYCYYNFQFDDAVFATYLKVLPIGSFEHSARIFADPSEVALFRLALDSLRIRSQLDLVLRVGINLSFCYRLMRIGDVLLIVHLKRFLAAITQSTRSNRPRQRPVPKCFAVTFIAFSVVVWIFANQAVTDSYAHCSRYPQCTYDDWVHPIDVFKTVQALAKPGELRSLQIINRQLLELPDELRSCRYLASMELFYTSIQRIPSWANEFTYLQTLHLEGKPDSQNLVTLPEDLFTDMPWLSAVHIGFHPNLANIPALSGVPNLKGLTLAWMLILTELPSFDRVPLLEHLLLTFLPHLERMPDMAPLRLVSNFSLSRAVQLCCNGFLGACDLNDSYCAYNPAAGIPAASCLDEEPFLGNMGTRDMFKKFESVVCQKQPSGMFLVGSTPTRQTIEMCDRRPFGQCQTPDGRTGICYNTRLQVLSCCGDENYIELRRYQIQLGVGQKCDPELEKWLGCEDEHKIVQ